MTAMTSIGYYPGCSLAGGGIELDLSIRAISRVAGVELREIADWNCCGASAAHSLNHELAVALPYRVLALASQQGLTEVLAPCAACFWRLKGTNVRLRRGGELLQRMLQITQRPYDGSVTILNASHYVTRLLEQGLADKLPRPLKGLKVAVYYGCLLSRGQDVVQDDAENPSAMDAAVRAAGAEPVAWNMATECCGGGFSMSMTEAVVHLSHTILADARAAGAAAVVTACPMCHSNLDMRQRAIRAAAPDEAPMPVLYLSELMGLAAGLEPKALGLDRHFTETADVVAQATAAAAESNLAASQGGSAGRVQ